MEKINLVELLRNCPSGMELDCALVENLYFDCINDSELDDPYPIQCYTQNGSYRTSIRFTEYGHFTFFDNSKCVIFPKGKTTWKGFVPCCNFKDGDVVACNCSDGNSQLFIFKEYDNNGGTVCYLFLDTDGSLDIDEFAWEIDRLATEEEKQILFDAIKANGYKWNSETKTLEELVESKFKDGDVIVCENHWGPFISIFKENVTERNGFIGHCVLDVDNNEFKVKDSASYFNKVRFATKREKEQLFRAIKDNGYKWNPDNKTLEKVEPKFKVGNKVRVKNGVSESRIIDGVFDTFYSLQMFGKIDFTDQDRWELVHDKFDLNILVPFESRVLVRNDKDQYWIPAFWGGKRTDGYTTTFGWSKYCIPFDGNKHLLNSNKECDKFYRTWEKTGD